MSVCSPALNTKPIPTCTQELVIGTIADANTSLAVVIKDITTERPEIIQAESDADGLVTIDISDHKFAANHSYELWIYLASNNYDDRELIILAPYVLDDTLALNFEDAYEGEQEQFVATSQTLEAA